VKVEILSENDLFYHYVHVCDMDAFREIKAKQKIMVEFLDYPNVIIRMLNLCIQESSTHLAVLVMQESGRARLDFIQNMEYKFVELLSTMFERSGEQIVQRHITYRYNALKARNTATEKRLTEVYNVVKLKNPSLLLQVSNGLEDGCIG
jgi:hypothetical protein